MLGAVFFVVVIIAGFNLLLYNFAQHEPLVASMLAKQRSVLDRSDEDLQILDITINETSRILNITAFNKGGRPIHLIRAWVTNDSSPTPWHYGYSIEYRINVATIAKGIGSGLGKFDPQETFTINLFSERGNLFVVRYAWESTVVPTASGSGWLTMDWSTYNYTVSVNGGNDQGPYGAWCVTNNGANRVYQFYTKVINHWDRDVHLFRESYLVFFQTSGGAQNLYIMAPSSTAKTPVGYTTQILVPANPLDQQAGGTPTTLKFLGDKPGSDKQKDSVLGSGGSFAVFLVLFYQDLSGVTLAQTIPFEASEVISTSSC